MKLSFLQPLLFASFLGLFSPATAQRNNPQLTIASGPLYSGEALNVFDLRPRETVVDSYWFEEWRKGGIILKDSQQITGYPLRYNLYSQSFEIQTVQDVKVLPHEQVHHAMLVAGQDTGIFVDLTRYLDLPPNPAFTGLSRVFTDGKYALFHRKEGEILKANYVPALDAGSITDKIVFSDAFYLYDGEYLEKLPSSRRKLIRFFNNRHEDVEAYIRSARINPRKPEDLVLLLNYLQME